MDFLNGVWVSGRGEYNLVLNIRQGGDPESSASRVRAGNTSCLLPRCRGCSPCSAAVTHWSPSSSVMGPAVSYVCFKQHLLVRLVQEPWFPPKDTLSMILTQMRASLTGKSSLYIWVPKDVERKKWIICRAGWPTEGSERRHSWDAPGLLEGVSWVQLGALDPSPGLLMPKGQQLLIFWAEWPPSFGFGEPSPWAGRQGVTPSSLPWLPLAEASVEGDVHTNKNYKYTEEQNVNLSVCVQAVHSLIGENEILQCSDTSFVGGV